MIPVFKPCFGKKEFEAVRKTMKSSWIGLGPKTKEFEEKFAQYIGVKYAVATNSATAALHLTVNSSASNSRALTRGAGPLGILFYA